MAVPTVLFVCMHNAGRSQIASALFNVYAGGAARATSAGVEPVAALNLVVIAAMREAGYDISAARPVALDDELLAEADCVITIGCADEPSCPPALTPGDWDVEDPAGAPMPKVRMIRDDIARRVRALLRDMGIEPVR